MRLAVGRKQFDNPPDVGHEAHVEHAIGFVQHEHLDRIELQAALVVEVEQTAGRGDDDVDTAAEQLHLRHLADTAVDGDMPHAAASYRTSGSCR